MPGLWLTRCCCLVSTTRIVHRDLKGGNALVTRSGVVKLTDFGASKIMTNAGQTDACVSMRGSVFWMAPEVLKGKQYGAWWRLKGQNPRGVWTPPEGFGGGLLWRAQLCHQRDAHGLCMCMEKGCLVGARPLPTCTDRLRRRGKQCHCRLLLLWNASRHHPLRSCPKLCCHVCTGVLCSYVSESQILPLTHHGTA
jgi:serine/threonine protein kinase